MTKRLASKYKINRRLGENLWGRAKSPVSKPRKGDTSENLIDLLERRLDTIIYRMKFAVTPFAARQFVNHGHVTINGKRLNIASYSVKDTDTIEVKSRPRNDSNGL